MVKKKLWELLLSPTHSIFLQLPRALVVSGLAAALDVGVLVLLVELAGWHPTFAAIISYLLGGVLQYVLSSIWVFPYAPRNAVIGFTAFSLLSLVGLAITWGTMWLLYDNLGIFYLFAKGVALLFAFCWNFLSRRYWLFRPPKEDSSQQQ
jgi:putative flippase GtrA